MLWHTQENTLPEAVMAVVKDRSKDLTDLKENVLQDGFIQRELMDILFVIEFPFSYSWHRIKK